METLKNMIVMMVNYYLKVDILKEKETEKEKNMIVMEI